MKKTYEKPEIQVMKIKTEQALLIISNPPIAGELPEEEEWD